MIWKNVQGLRGIAALLVVFAHTHDVSEKVAYEPLLKTFAPLGACGVDLFFVISGFIMISVHWNDFLGVRSSRRFLLRRWIRIFPPYWVVTLILALTFALAPGLRHHWLGGHSNVLLSLLLIPQYDPSAELLIAAPLLFVGWTLLYEMYFYYAFAGALRLPRKVALSAFVGWGVAIVILQFVPVAFLNPVSAFLSRALITEFLLGVYVGYLVMRGSYYAPAAFLGIGVSVLLASDAFLMAALHGSWGAKDGFRALGWGVAMACILYGTIGLEKRGNVFSKPFQHAPLFVALGKLILAFGYRVHVPAIMLAVVVPAVVVAVALQLYRFVDAPLTAYARRFATDAFPSLMLSRSALASFGPEVGLLPGTR